MNDNIDAVNCAGSVRRYSAHSRLMRKIKGRSVRYGQPLRQRELGLLEHGVATSLAYKTCIRIGWGIGHWTLCCWTLCWSLCPFIHVHNLSPVYRAAWVDVELWWAMCQRYNWCNVVLKFVSACDRCATRNIWTLIHIVFVMIDCVPRLGHNYATINVGTQHGGSAVGSASEWIKRLVRHATCERSTVSRGEGQQKAEVHRDLEQARRVDIDGVGKGLGIGEWRTVKCWGPLRSETTRSVEGADLRWVARLFGGRLERQQATEHWWREIDSGWRNQRTPTKLQKLIDQVVSL